MDGFTLSYITSPTEIESQIKSFGQIEYIPKIKYIFEEDNPLNPAEIIRFGKYHADEFLLEFPSDSDDYVEFYNFMNDIVLYNADNPAAGLYLSWEQGDDVTKEFKITKILELPPAEDDLNVSSRRAKIQVKLESRYENNPGMPEFTTWGADDTWGEGLWGW
jgi:hypothetical protein